MNLRGILSSFCLAPSDDTFLRLTCRPLGLLSWPLSKLRLQDTGTLTINRRCLDYRSSSYKSFSSCAIPLSNITSVSCGSGKPYSYLIFAAFFVLLAILLFNGEHHMVAAGICLMLSGLCALRYFTQQHFFIRIEHGDDNVFCITLHPGLVEGIAVRPQQVEAACAIIRASMLQRPNPAP